MKTRTKRQITLLVLAFSMSLLGGCDESTERSKPASVKVESQAQTSPTYADLSDPDAFMPNWHGIRRMILQCYISNKPCRVDDCLLEESGDLHGNLLTLDIEFNPIGLKTMREEFSKNYLVSLSDGSIYFVNPRDLANPSKFQNLRADYLKGAEIQRIGFGKGREVPASNLRRLIMGDNLAKSLIEEVLGKQTQRPEGFSQWREEYRDKAISRLFRIDTSSGVEDQLVGWIIDLYSPRVQCAGKDYGHFVLKRIILMDDGLKAPRYVVTRPPGAIFEKGKPFEYNGEVVNDQGVPSTEGIFKAFGPGKVYFDINGPPRQ